VYCGCTAAASGPAWPRLLASHRELLVAATCVAPAPSPLVSLLPYGASGGAAAPHWGNGLVAAAMRLLACTIQPLAAVQLFTCAPCLPCNATLRNVCFREAHLAALLLSQTTRDAGMLSTTVSALHTAHFMSLCLLQGVQQHAERRRGRRTP
jgi:hypothetical protein